MARSIPVARFHQEVGLAIHELEVTNDPGLVVRNLLHRVVHLEAEQRPTLKDRLFNLKRWLGIDSGYIQWKE